MAGIETTMLNNGAQQISGQISAKFQGELLASQTQISSWLSRAYQVQTDLETKAMLYERQTSGLHMNKAGIYYSDKRSRIYERWYAAKQVIEEQADTRKVETLLKEGYLLIDQLRHKFTGETVTYQVAFSVSIAKKTYVYEAALPLQEIMNMAKIEAVWRNSSAASSLKLRLNATAKDRSDWVTKYSAVNITDDEIYKEVMSYEKIINLKNKGNKYEIYKKFARLSQELNISDKQMRQELLDEIIQEVKSNTASFVKGGDDQYLDKYGQKQSISLKSFLGGNPSLASLSTMIPALEQTYAALDLQALSASAVYGPTRARLKEKGGVEADIEKAIKEKMKEELAKIFQ